MGTGEDLVCWDGCSISNDPPATSGEEGGGGAGGGA